MATTSEGLIAFSEGDLPTAVALGEEALQGLGERPDELSARISGLLLLALAKNQLGEYDEAAVVGEEARDLSVKKSAQWYLSWALVSLGFSELGRLHVSAAADYAREVLRIARDVRDVTGAGLATMLMAGATVLSGDHTRAAALLGLTRRLGETATLLRSIAFYDSTTTLFEKLARDAIGEAAFQAAAARGQDFDFVQAVDFALGESSGDAAPAPNTPTGPDRELLSKREWQVAELVAQGMSNKDIATELVISQRTAEGHVQKILRKLGFRSRTQIVSWASGRTEE
jgi:non-specific serine/threonine protein kinase